MPYYSRYNHFPRSYEPRTSYSYSRNYYGSEPGRNYYTSEPGDFKERLRQRYPTLYNRFETYDSHSINNPTSSRFHHKPDESKVLTVKKVDFCVAINGPKHHTDEYDISSPFKLSPKLVVRRGQEFIIEIDFSRPYDVKKDDLRLVFQAGENPLPSKKTHVEFILSDEDLPNQWGAMISKRQGNSLTIKIFTPPDCFVAKWNFKVDVVEKVNTEINVYRYSHIDPIYIIFNPWCKADSVYLDNEKELEEYIMNESGKIYSGSQKSIQAKPWNFGQFETCILDVAMYLLDNNKLNWSVRGNPVNIVRKISSVMNSCDNGGVLVGNWSGDYSGGRSPLSWTGSAAILERYWDDKRPVRYGQCWVFSGICTTVCRALGIPARSVTNFASAHDTDASITIDVMLDPNWDVDKAATDDSVWNFHVWNEAWMSRPDLPSGYGGWQAFDATPQELSDDIYCCGPASVRAICEGEVNMPYDLPFVFAEVNADRMYWMTDKDGNNKPVQTEKNAVGKFISTKMPGSSERLDVTLNYKAKEGSAAERAAVRKANHLGSCRPDVYQCKATDVEFMLENDADATLVGQDFKLSLKIKNRGQQVRTVNGRIGVRTMHYTGVLADDVKIIPIKDKVVQPGKAGSVEVVAAVGEYMDKLRDGFMLDVCVFTTVKETDQAFTAKDNFVLRKPNLNIKGPSEGKKEQEFKIDVSFVNPLDVMLTECQVTVDGLAKSLTFPQGNVQPRGTFTATLPITPQKKGKKELICIFGSRQLDDINGSKDILIKV